MGTNASRFHPLSSSVGIGEEPDVPRLDRSSAVRLDRTADYRDDLGLVEAAMGPTQTVYVALFSISSRQFACFGMGSGDSRSLLYGQNLGMFDQSLAAKKSMTC